jgi:hypothetical protein
MLEFRLSREGRLELWANNKVHWKKMQMMLVADVLLIHNYECEVDHLFQQMMLQSVKSVKSRGSMCENQPLLKAVTERNVEEVKRLLDTNEGGLSINAQCIFM